MSIIPLLHLEQVKLMKLLREGVGEGRRINGGRR